MYVYDRLIYHNNLITTKVQDHTTRDASQDVKNNYLNNFIKLINFINHSCIHHYDKYNFIKFSKIPS
jgi:hypothetical protein